MDLSFLDVTIKGYGSQITTTIKGIPIEYNFHKLVSFLSTYFGTTVNSENELIVIRGSIEIKYINMAIRAYLSSIPKEE